jgi:hypothetical protein
MYEIIGPGAGYKPPQHDVAGRAWLGKPKGRGDWVPTLTPTQDEVDFILLAVLGPNFAAPTKGHEGPAPLGTEGRGGGADGADAEGQHADGLAALDAEERRQRKHKFRAPSPIAESWQVETRGRKCVRLAVSHAGFTGSLNQSARRLTWLEELELPALRPW